VLRRVAAPAQVRKVVAVDCLPGRAVIAIAACLGLAACNYFPDHHLVHPRTQPAGVATWSDAVLAGALLIHVRGARPPGDGPFPLVIVHPEGGKTAREMEGIIWDLAQHGYAAVAADYERWIDGAYRRNLFAWRSAADVTAIVDIARSYPGVDRDRIGLLGFSQGGVISLLIAAHAPDRVAAVVSYYPVTDFPGWLGTQRSGAGERAAFGVVRWFFRRQSGAADDAEFDRMLEAASPYYVADRITAPVLLVHGDRDGTAPVDESRRMADRLAASGHPVELLVIPGGVHIFNFRQRQHAATAWEATLAWLDRYLRGNDGSPAPHAGLPLPAGEGQGEGIR
jgi:dipeptidyl aminopeptidase/acylaminoacyl peptidase